MSRIWLWPTLLLLTLACNRQPDVFEPVHAAFLQSQSTWVDSMLLEMSLDEKIGQLILYRPDFTTKNTKDSIFRYARHNQLGGVQLESLKLNEYLLLIDSLQRLSGIPLFNASNQSVSLNNQFRDLKQFPLPATISANKSDKVKTELREKLIRQFQNLEVNLVFGPWMNRNDSTASAYDFQVFENQRAAQLQSSAELSDKLKTQKIISVAGNFSDYQPVENDTTGYLDSLLHPYSVLVQKGLTGIFVDPAIFAIDTISRLPGQFLKRFLKKHTAFDGLLFGEWTEEAPFEELLHAGVDVFMVNGEVDAKVAYIRRYVDEGLFLKADLNEKVRKILQAKVWRGLDTIRPDIQNEAVIPLMVDENDDFYLRQLYESSLTLAQNPNRLLPFKDTYRRDFRLLKIGKDDLWDFEYYFSKYAGYKNYLYSPDKNGRLKELDFHRFKRSKLIITLDNIQLKTERDTGFIQSVNKLAGKTEVVLINFGNPLNLSAFDSTLALVQLFERNNVTESLAAQLLFGALQAKGQLPLALNERLHYKKDIDDTPVIRFKYTVPEEVGIASYKLVGIDAIAQSAIADRATPGCQVLVAKEGKIIYSKTFGTHTYRKKQLVQQSDLYDIASITKVASTTLAAMKLYEEGDLSVNNRINKYLEMEEKSPIRNITLKQLLTHKSGLQPNMPIAPYILHKDTVDAYCNDFFCTEDILTYGVQVADSFYLNAKWQDTIWQEIYNLEPRRKNRYRYSDVNFNLLQKIIETRSEERLDEFVYQHFYQPLNLEHITYKPLKKFDAKEIVPTANDEKWRKQLLRGYVHDESAALLGGVGGNAGLFANAEDLAVIFQMLLEQGSYGGKKVFEPETVKKFTSSQSGVDRGLGFDVKGKGHRSCSPKASAATFGHTGFTGTCVWVDPQTELIYIFLSNRIHPEVNNRKLFRKGVRTRIHNLVYDALDTYPEDHSVPEEREVIHARIDD